MQFFEGVGPRDWLAGHDVLAYLHNADPAEMGREALAVAGVDALERFPDNRIDAWGRGQNHRRKLPTPRSVRRWLASLFS